MQIAGRKRHSRHRHQDGPDIDLDAIGREHSGGHFCKHIALDAAVIADGHGRLCKVLFQIIGQALGLVGPAQIGSLRHVQQLTRRAVGLGGIPLDLAGVAHDLGDQLGQLLDGQLLAGTSVDRLVAGVVVHQEDAQVCKVVHI